MATNYPLRHDPLWLAKVYRTTATPGHHAAGPGHKPTRGGTSVTGLHRRGLPLAASLGHWGRGRFGSQADAWGAAKIDRPAAGALTAAVAPRGQGPWLSQR